MNKLFKSSEETVSMFLGLVIVIVIVGLVFNFFQRRRGSVSLTGVTDNKKETQLSKPTETVDNSSYEVKKGDSLWKIAEEKLGSGYKWVDIAKNNNLNNPGVIEVGQKLSLSGVKVEVKTESLSEGYVVKRGDSLWKIAVASYGDGFQWTKIWQANKNQLNNPGQIEIGMRLVMPKIN